MRIVPFIITATITAGFIFALNNKWGATPPIGKFLSPQQGFWQNAEATNHNFTVDLKFPQLKGKAEVYFDDRLVPHVFAGSDEDAYFVQGYLHAKFRLWQMEFQTLAAAGRISEKLGSDPRFINFDKEQRRSGMVYAAENALKEFEDNTLSKSACDAYTSGVNAYISTLTENNLPIEYKLLDYKPEQWNNLKIALFLKQMSKTLAGYDSDLENTLTKSTFSFEELMVLKPQISDSSEPIVPKGTPFDPPAIVPFKPASGDSLYFGKKDTTSVRQVSKPDPDNGSNNWAVSGMLTRSGAPILCNDPHLELTFPSIWYEMQITTPNIHAYGATFPGSPNIIIGFNDSIAWGVTNSQRDVRDYYEIQFKDSSKHEYLFNDNWEKTKLRIEEIKVRGKGLVYDTVAYTVFGPVIFDSHFSNKLSKGKAIALRWTAHDASNEGLTFYKLNRAKNYGDYLEAIEPFSCPGQNFLFAGKSGDIAIWQQGKFPARWFGQGIYLMPGIDSSYMWQGFIPLNENPHVINPDRRFLQSANQRPVDSTYPYFIPGNYIIPRGIAITKKLSGMTQITPRDMMALQNDNYNVFAASVRPLFLKYTKEYALDSTAKRYFNEFKKWDLQNTATSVGPTIFQNWFDNLEILVWQDELKKDSQIVIWPDEQTLLEAINKDTRIKYIDNVNTPEIETLQDLVTSALQTASAYLRKEEREGKLQWTKHKNPTIYHLLRTAVMPFARTGIPVGGGSNIINATTHSHGPSWRMIVHLTKQTEAYAVYPGGQSGNPGSRFYDSFVDTWASGKYYKLWVMDKLDAGDKKVKCRMTFSNLKI